MQLINILVVLALATVVSTRRKWTFTLRDLMQAEWDEYKLRYKKVYNNETENIFHKKIYVENKFNVLFHNLRYYNGKTSFRLGINKFSDMPVRQVEHAMNGYQRRTSQQQPKSEPTS
ncbi:unnamed protein product, partial [Brenthis ino]